MFAIWILFLDYPIVKVAILFILVLTSLPSLCIKSPTLKVGKHSAHLGVVIFSFQTLLDYLVNQKWYCKTVIQGLLLIFGRPYGNC